MSTPLIMSLFAAAVCSMPALFGSAGPSAVSEEPTEPSPYVLGYEMKRIDGTPERLEKYKGKVLLLVNTASECGLTPQYAGLEAIYRKYKDRGFVVLGFPANNFKGQEPGTNEQIAELCRERFDVTFPMFEKISVKGEDVHPLYRQISSLPDPVGIEPTWNFTKYLVDREGNAVARFDPKTEPTDAVLIERIELLLGDG